MKNFFFFHFTDYLFFVKDYRNAFPLLRSLDCHLFQWKIPRVQENKRSVDSVIITFVSHRGRHVTNGACDDGALF